MGNSEIFHCALSKQTSILELGASLWGLYKIALFSYFDKIFDEMGWMNGMGMLRLREMDARAYLNWRFPIIKIISCACEKC